MSSSAHVACGDCERIRPGRVAQPANTASSLALVAVAPAVWQLAGRRGDRAWRSVAVASTLAGVGSAAYHGPGGMASKALHDAGVVGLVAALAAAAAVRPPRGRSPAVLAAVAGLLHAASRTGGPLCRPESLLQGHAAWHVLAAVAVHRAAATAMR